MYDPSPHDEFSSRFQQAESSSFYNPPPRADFNSQFKQAESGLLYENAFGQDTKTAGRKGILITALCGATLLILLFAPFMVVEEKEYSWDYGGIEEESSSWQLVDFFGNEYIFGDDQVQWDAMDSLDSGRWQGLWGSILAVLMGVGLIVFGNLKAPNEEVRKAYCFVRGLIAIGLLFPAVMMILIGSKFFGLFVSTTLSTDMNILLPITPLITAGIGIAVMAVSLGVLRHEKDVMRAINRRRRTGLSTVRTLFENKSNNLTKAMLICSALVLVTMHALPIIIMTENINGESQTLMLSMGLADGMGFFGGNFGDAVDSFSTFHSITWFAFAIVVFVIFAQFFYTSNWNPQTGNVLLVCGTGIYLALLLQVIFKILGIVNTFQASADLREFGDVSVFYGFNYLPLLALIGLIIASVMFGIHAIKGLQNVLKGAEIPIIEKKEGSIFDDFDLEVPTTPGTVPSAPPQSYSPPVFTDDIDNW